MERVIFGKEEPVASRFCRMADRKYEPDYCPASHSGRLGPYPPAVPADDPLAKRKSHPGSGNVSAVKSFHWLKDAPKAFRRNALSVILDRASPFLANSFR